MSRTAKPALQPMIVTDALGGKAFLMDFQAAEAYEIPQELPSF